MSISQASRLGIEALNAINPLVRRLTQTDGQLDPFDRTVDNLWERLDPLLDELERVVMTPQVKQELKIEEKIKALFMRDDARFPAKYAEKAKSLYEKWQEARWGVPAAIEHGGDGDEGGSGSGTGERRTSTSSGVVLLPPKQHKIYGKDGIMHGMAIAEKGHRARDERYTKRDANVHGHHGFQVGQWFAFQEIAAFRGAHGEYQKGIYGNEKHGAYSIVLSKEYDALDNDQGETLYYCGPESKTHTDPDNLPKPGSGTKALEASRKDRANKPVRVLRSWNSGSRWAPSKGFRYDGLYDVVGFSKQKNTEGGLYKRFELKRRGGQGAMEDLLGSPTREERKAYDKIADVDTGDWARSEKGPRRGSSRPGGAV